MPKPLSPVREVQSHSCEWLKQTSENGGTPPTVALVCATSSVCIISHHIIKIKIHSSCDIKIFVETHLVQAVCDSPIAGITVCCVSSSRI